VPSLQSEVLGGREGGRGIWWRGNVGGRPSTWGYDMIDSFTGTKDTCAMGADQLKAIVHLDHMVPPRC